MRKRRGYTVSWFEEGRITASSEGPWMHLDEAIAAAGILAWDHGVDVIVQKPFGRAQHVKPVARVTVECLGTPL